jgi:starch-binding outer membrane protein, SusD/RagB family
MKKYLILILATFLISSCNEDFLEKSNPNKMTSGNFYKTEKDALAAVNAAYSSFQRQGGYNRMGIHAYTVRSDEGVFTSYVTGAPAVTGLDDFTVTSGTECVQAIWQDHYKGVYFANMVLEKVPGIEMDAAIKDRCLGEAYFLRALYHFQLILYFGEEIPIYSSVPKESVDLYPKSAEKGVGYDLIIEDLKKAKELLPIVDTYRGTDNLGRASRGSAAAYLGKVYLFLKRYQDAADEFKDVIDGNCGTYKLMQNFRDNHDERFENNEESLFEIQFKLSGGNGFGDIDLPTGSESQLIEGEATMVRGGGRMNWNAMPNQDFLAEFETGDPRFYQTFWTKGGDMYTDYKGVPKTYEEYCPKFYNGLSFWRKWCRDWGILEDSFDSNVNVRVMRYADVLLMYAECLIEGATGDTPEKYINMVRDRARNDTNTDFYPTGGSIPTVEELIAAAPVIRGVKIDNLRDALRHERAVELAFEFKRWDDIWRWGIMEQTLRAGYKHYLPIYQGDLDSNPNLKPNESN